MDLRPVVPVDGAAAGAWIPSAISGGPGPLVKEQIPARYEAYLRILHPVRDSSGNPVTWASVANELGRQPHGQMQWHAIVGSQSPASMADSAWRGSRPALGELPTGSLETLCAVLERHTDDMDCFFGLSTIHPEIDQDLVNEPLLEIPYREFVVLSGPLSAVLSAGDAIPVAPSLMWPADRTWYVASEYDFDSTLAGGSKDLIRDLGVSSNLETWVVSPEDSLAEDADKLNPVTSFPKGR